MTLSPGVSLKRTGFSLSQRLRTEQKQAVTPHLQGALGFPQELLALGLQPHGPLLDGTEAGATAGGSKVKSY